MSRSKWKGPHTVTNKINYYKHLNLVEHRNVEITPNLTDVTFKVYNGKDYFKVLVTNPMIGHKLGEFVFTRKKYYFKKKTKIKVTKKKKVKKKVTKK